MELTNNKMNNIKRALIGTLKDIINQKIENAQKAVEAAKESRDNETKSSVGDKYETGRAMMQIEQERNEVQLINAQQLQKELSRIKADQLFTQVEVGSLVMTNRGSYFISIGIGKVELDGNKYFAVSVAAPITEAMLGKKAGDSVDFMGNQLNIIKIA